MASRITPNQKLDSQRRAFIDNYLIDFNAKRAYLEIISAKCSPESASSLASKLLQDVNVQQYLNEKLLERKALLHIDQSYVVRKLLDITEIDYVDSIQHVTRSELEKIPKDVRKLIQSIKLVKTRNRNETDKGFVNETESEKYEITFMSKDKALELLGKHTGTFMRDNIQLNADMGRMSFTDALRELDI